MFGRCERNCASVVISFAIVVCVGEFHLLCVGMLVERGKLDKGDFGVYALPAVESDNNAMHGKEQVVIRLLEGLGYGVKLALVGAGVVALSFARH